MRTLLAQVDGDGEWSVEWLEKLLYLLRKHPAIKFTVGVIVCYFDGTLRAKDLEERTGFMNEILGQSNVEPACHSWSHPMDWRAPQSINLVKFGMPLTVNQEIIYATDFIEKHLTDKRVKVYELTGDCNPTAEQLKVIHDRGLYPFNGGSVDVNGQWDFPYEYMEVGGYRQYCQRAWADVYYTGLRKYRIENGQNVAYVERPEGYKTVLNYFKAHPDRPIHVYFHVYCAEFRPTFGSVDYVLSEVEKWGLESLYLSEYAERLMVEPPS